jgi:predicted hotdog family 3-hydroxylacyl-ACP dehydratase
MSATIDIQHFLPHRKPMLMVDLILELDKEKVRTVFEISPENIFVENGYFAAVGLIENAAQTCSSIVAQEYFEKTDLENKDKKDVIGFISSIKTLKVYSLPKAGEKIETLATLIASYATEIYTTCTMKCETFCSENLLMECEINLFIKEKADEKE